MLRNIFTVILEDEATNVTDLKSYLWKLNHILMEMFETYWTLWTEGGEIMWLEKQQTFKAILKTTCSV